jgi:hypothetical protein
MAEGKPSANIELEVMNLDVAFSRMSHAVK